MLLEAVGSTSGSGSATTLSYSYTGNRLSSIGSASYAYDIDGNLITDGRRGLSLTYNLLGHTANVSSGGTVKASYTYLSDGSLYEVTNGSDGYRYLGSFIYNRNSSLESVAFGGGRIFMNGGTYSVDYHISDHLGSIRAIVRNGSVIEQNDYYPFGSRQDNGLPVQTSPVANRFRFNGKELQSTGSLGYLNYGARFYDPDIARWNACDVLADVQNGLSPYSFCGGNPILNVDDNGNIFETVWDAVSLVMGVKSFVGNVRQGNVGAAILDGVGIVGDALSVATPLVPGGFSAGIAAARIAKNADNVVDAVKAADKAVDAAKSSNKMGDGIRAVEKLRNDTNSPITTSRAARREVMRKEGIPTSQKPLSQSSNSSGREYTYELPTSYGGTKRKSVQQQTKDSSHPYTPHWEGGDVKIHDGKIETNRYGRPRLLNGKTKVEYDEINHYN